jgi:hypothetical protein
MTRTISPSDALLELAERCEAATGPDRALDRDIGLALFDRASPTVPEFIHSEAHEAYISLQRSVVSGEHYTASVDAALTLVPDGWHVTHSGEGRFLTRGRFVVTLETWGIEQAEDGSDIHTTPNRRHGVAETFALAICAAALRARAAQ